MDATLHQRNRKFLQRALLVCASMFLFGFACVPIYRIACEHGYLGGRLRNLPDNAERALSFKADESRWVNVQFVANVNSALAWRFAPEKVSVRVHPGALTEAWFDATNDAPHAIVGNAVPSVAPNKVSRFFNKTECFCFTEQTLASGESRRMPVRFVVDPQLPADVDTLTLSYTFYNNEAATKKLAAAGIGDRRSEIGEKPGSEISDLRSPISN
jgi:cytochrome c oxidase assembly protein subunit 11